MNKLCWGFIIICLTYSSAEAKQISRPPKSREIPVIEYNYLKQLYDNFNRLEITDTAPNGNRVGNKGEMIAYNNNGVLEFWINSNGNTTWQKIFPTPMGEINYFNITGVAVSIASVSNGSTNMVKVAPTTTLNNDNGFDNGGANNGRLRYTGAVTKTFHVACTISFAPDAANDVFVIGIAKNGTVIDSSKVLHRVINANDTNSTALHVMTSLATNDYLELYVGNTTDADDFTIKSLTLFAMGM